MGERIALVAGARPNFMKVAPLWAAFERAAVFDVQLIHTGQHYDRLMSDVFFADLGLPSPDATLDVGSGSHGRQTAAVMVAFEELCESLGFDLTIVVGDVNSTLACALVARKLGIGVAHVEAGLRSRNWSMPEETNRVLTDVISDYLFTPSEDANENLRGEGIAADRLHLVGNVMIDSLVRAVEGADKSTVRERLKIDDGYGLVTIHRPSNVDDPEQLAAILFAFSSIDAQLIFPVHPRTQKEIARLGIEGSTNLRTIDPLGYYDFVALMRSADFVITDSGGVQEETTYLDVPCLTLRPETERPITIAQGTNELTTLETMNEQISRILAGSWKATEVPELWDGRASTRVVEILEAGIGPKLPGASGAG